MPTLGRGTHAVTPHLAVADISLFALLKQQRTEVCSARALRLSFELAWLGSRP